jgi:glutamyl-tRNA(Gln) amidotransferase subunit D
MYSERIEKLLKAKGISAGDEVRLTSPDGTLEGVLIPRPDSGNNEIVIIKLKNGYNIGMLLDGKTKIEKSASGFRETFSFPKVKLKENRKLPKVALIYTGGTIGSKLDYHTGGVSMLTKPEELLYTVPELSDIADLEIRNLLSIASEDMTYIEWQKMAKEIAESINGGARGVVVTHGTDTMHYTSAALSFMLSGLNAPVVITGAQRSSDRGSSDAFTNLISAVRIASESGIAEVGICMHANSSDGFCNFIRGTKARKMHTSRRDAFRPINNKPIAKVDSDGKIEYLNGYRKTSAGKGKVKAVTGFEPKVALLKFYPNSDPELIEWYVGKGYKGIIIEGTGLGHTAVTQGEGKHPWPKHIKNAVDSGVVVGMTSQCLNGRVSSTVYANLRLISKAGATYCEDMLPEVALVKLGFLLGNYDRKKAAELLSKNIAGEITERTGVDAFLV